MRTGAALIAGLAGAIAVAGVLAFAGCSGRAAVEPVTAIQVDSLLRSSEAKVILLNVWATWCQPCLDEMPAIVKLRAEFNHRDLEVILLSADDLSERDSAVVPFLGRVGVDFPTYIFAQMPGDGQDALIRSLDPEWSGALPATFLTVRGSGTTRTLVGERSYEVLKREVEVLLPE